MRGAVENAKGIKATTTTSPQKSNQKRYAKEERIKKFVRIVKNQHPTYSCLGTITLTKMALGYVLHTIKGGIMVA